MRRVMRWVGYVVGVVIVVLAGGVGYVYAASNAKADKLYEVASRPVPVGTDAAAIARGKHLAFAIAKCVDCHGEDLGGTVMIDDPTLGLLVAPNITTGGKLASYTDAEVARAIRHGIKRDGRGTLIMPSEDYQYLADDDVGAIISYVKSVPALANDPGVTRLRPVGRALLVAGVLPFYAAEKVDHNRVPPATMPPDTTVVYGAYLANGGGCTGCHGPGLSGGPIPGMPPEFPPAANLTPTGIGRYSDTQVESMLRTGKRPDGSEIKTIMPWKYTAMMTPTEMRATIKYLRSVPGKPFGQR